MKSSDDSWNLADDIEALRWELYGLRIPGDHDAWRALDRAAHAIRARDLDKAGSFVAFAAESIATVRSARSATVAANDARRRRYRNLVHRVLSLFDKYDANWRRAHGERPASRHAFALKVTGRKDIYRFNKRATDVLRSSNVVSAPEFNCEPYVIERILKRYRPRKKV